MTMTMISAEGLVTAYTRNASYVRTHLAGLTHADALVQPPVAGNCILWVVGHIVCYRNYIMRALGQPAVLPEAQAARFAKDSAPVLADEPGLTRLEALVIAFEQAQEQILLKVRELNEAQALEVITQGDFTMPRAELLMSYMRHESYHSGQLELLRQLALHARNGK